MKLACSTHLLVAIVVSCLCACSSLRSYPLWVSCSADEQLKESNTHLMRGKVSIAVNALEEYVKQRDKEQLLPGENPSFYFITMGDLYLDSRDPIQAELKYEEAERRAVDKSLVADRYIRLAEFLRIEGKTGQAMEVLNRHAALNPLVFDGYRDKVARSWDMKSKVSSTPRSAHTGKE